MRRLIGGAAVFAALAVGAGWALTRPETISPGDIAAITPDTAAGKTVFHAAGCASCHAAPDATGEEKLVLSGGHAFQTPVGTFRAPNISPDPEHGIGAWTIAEIVTATMRGTSPDGRHYYPAFPYASYARAELADMVHLAAYLKTLPPSDTPSQPHDLDFPFNIRAGVGAWKVANISGEFVGPAATEQEARGRYLAEALGHCAECHTPRDATQGLDTSRWMAGAPNPSGRGRIPNITPAALDWSAADLKTFLTTGFMPDFDTVGGSMVAVVEDLAQLPESDIDALVAYLRALPPVDSAD